MPTGSEANLGRSCLQEIKLIQPNTTESNKITKETKIDDND